MFGRIRAMIVKEFIQVFRDRRMKAIIFVTPLLQLMLFGYAVTTDVTNIPTAFCDLDGSRQSRELLEKLTSSGFFRVLYSPKNPRELKNLLDEGRVLCAIEIKKGFSESLRRGSMDDIQIILDGTDSNTATVAVDYANRIIMRFAGEYSAPTPGRRAVSLQSRSWYNPDLRSRNYNVPGVIAMILMLTCLLLTSMSVVREREKGTIEQLMVSPLTPLELMIGKTVPFAVIGFFDVALITLAAVFWFDIPIKGSLLTLVPSTAAYLLSVLGIGLFISTISATQQQALMATFLFYVPAVLLSGFIFPIENMPLMIQYATSINPLRYYLVIVRGIFLKGSGMVLLMPQTASLLSLGVVVSALSAVRFKKRTG